VQNCEPHNTESRDWYVAARSLTSPDPQQYYIGSVSNHVNAEVSVSIPAYFSHVKKVRCSITSQQRAGIIITYLQVGQDLAVPLA
jgi:hypothetical protein